MFYLWLFGALNTSVEQGEEVSASPTSGIRVEGCYWHKEDSLIAQGSFAAATHTKCSTKFPRVFATCGRLSLRCSIPGYIDHWINITKLSKGSMAKSMIFCCVILGFLCLTALAKSPRPITDYEIREKKNACYADIESGLWGWQCKSSMIAKENCALRCLSPVCYSLVYESDPLEEGEKDYARSQEYKYCMHRISMGESLDGVKGAFDV